MKLLHGETLAARLRKSHIEAGEALRIAHEVGAGLEAIHTLGIVHRDLKPSNVFLEQIGETERAVVTDFGLARTRSEEMSLTSAGQIVGTPGYLAPELRNGEPATPKSDIYAFGILLHELLLGERPGDALTISTATRIEPRISRCRSVIARCIARNPQQRFATAEEVVAALDSAFNEVLRSRRTILIAGAVLVGAGSAATWVERNAIEHLLHPLPRPRHVAILPAPDSKTSVEDISLLGGILEAASVQLARTEKFERDLLIVPPGFLRRRDAATIKQALGLFGANLLLNGWLLRATEAIIVQLRLLEASSGKVLRHASVSAPFNSLYALTGLVADRAAFLLDVNPQHLTSVENVAGTTNSEAYAAYQRGRGFMRGYGLSATDQAIAELQKALDLDPYFSRAWASLSEAYSMRFHLSRDSAALELAERTSSKAMNLAPDLPAAISSRARTELYRGRYKEAIDDAQKAAALDPDDVEPQIALAEIYVRSGKLALAEQTYQRLSNNRPNDWLILNDWGDLCIDQANYTKAEKLLREATLLAPQAALPWRNLGAVYLATGKLTEADTALNRSIAILPSGEAYSNLGTVLFWLRKYSKAADAYSKAVELNPQHPLLWRNLGDAYQMIGGMRDKAKAAWKKAADLSAEQLEVNPNNVDVLVSLALYRAKLGETSAALALLNKADKLPGRTVEQLFYESEAYELAGKRDSALQLLRTCVTLGYSRADISNAPELANLRRDPRFRRLGLDTASQ